MKTETALHSIVSIVENTFANKEYTIATFMDIAGAFDNVSFNAINNSIEKLNVSKQVSSWIKHMLSHRYITIDLNGSKMTVKATRGTPQGGVISPMLWICIMDALLRSLHQCGYKAVGYADDLTILCQGKHLHILSDRTQQAVRIVETWCKEVSLTVNPDKSEVIVFTKKFKLEGFKNPKIFGKEITKTDTVKYLGITLDSKLRWHKHLECRISKCMKIFWCCRTAIGKTWGLTPKSILWIYTAIVKPLLAYGSFLWWNGVQTGTQQKKLSHLQRVACLAITGAMNTTPQNAMEALLNLPKLEKYIEAEAKNTAYRLRGSITDLQTHTARHVCILQDLYKQNAILEANNDYIQTVHIFNRAFKIHTPTKEAWMNGKARVNYRTHTYFTDGSVSKQNSGYGVLYAPTHSVIKVHCGKLTTITQVELAAIHACCIDAISKKLKGGISIYSDSLAAISALKKYEINSALALKCIKMLEQLAASNKVDIIWIPAHSGIYGNETADKIARFAANESIFSVEPHIMADNQQARATNDNWLLRETNLSWAATQGCEHTKCFIEQTTPALTKQILSMSKQNARIVTGILTGHCKLNSHLAKIGLRDDPDCDLCGHSRETAKHILCECKALATVREQIYGCSTIEPRQICRFPLQNDFYKKSSETNLHISSVFQK